MNDDTRLDMSDIPEPKNICTVCGGRGFTEDGGSAIGRAFIFGKNSDLLAALEESVKLQSHYASQLNYNDGGKRMLFSSAKEWMARLESLKSTTPGGG